jgi:cobalt-zinc-cadmium efflux system membrane fusion protein
MTNRDLLRPKNILIVVGVLALAAFAWIFFSGGQPKKGASAKDPKQGKESHQEGQVKLDPEALTRAKIEVVEVSRSPMENRVQFAGELSFNEERLARVSSRLAGRVVKIAVDYGAPVRQGDVLAVIDSVELGQAQNSFMQAVASYRVAQKAFERARILWQEKAISQAEFLERQSKFELAQSEIDYAENRLHLLGLNDADIGRLLQGSRARSGPGGFHANVESTFALRSPIAGQVVDRKVTPGLVVKVDEELFTVADITSLWCFIQIPEKDLHLAKRGSQAVLRVSSQPQEEFPGVIDYVSETVDKASRMARARVRVDNSQGRLKAGMFATVQVAAGTIEGLNVPEAAVLAAGDDAYVFVEKEPGVYEKRLVKPGLKTGGRVEIVNGLAPGERVVVQGGFTLKSELEKESLEAE